MRRDDDRSPPEWPWGSGLVLFRPGTPPRRRRRRLIFVVLALLIASLVVWPLYPHAALLEPAVFGLPFGFAWVLGALAAMFSCVLVLYRADRRENPRED